MQSDRWPPPTLAPPPHQPPTSPIKPLFHRHQLHRLIPVLPILAASLTRAEHPELDHYLVAFEELQERRKKLAPMGDIIRHGAPELTEKFSSENGMDRLQSHFELAASCLITGLSNGVTIRMDNLEHVYSDLDLSEQNVHATIGNLYTSLLNAYSDPIDHFGDLDFELDRQGLPRRGAVASLIA